MARRDFALKLRDARRHDSRLSMLNQFKQSMAAPDWEIDDYEWYVLRCWFGGCWVSRVLGTTLTYKKSLEHTQVWDYLATRALVITLHQEY